MLHYDKYSKNRKGTASPRTNFKPKNRGNKSEDSKISSDDEKTCRGNEESETIEHIRNLKYGDIGPGKVKEMLSPKKNTMPLQRHSELSLKSNELSEDDKDPRSKKTIELVRDNQ